MEAVAADGAVTMVRNHHNLDPFDRPLKYRLCRAQVLQRGQPRTRPQCALTGAANTRAHASPPHGEHARIRFIGASQKTCVRASHRMHRCMALSALHSLARGIHTTTLSSAAGGLRYGRIFCCRLCGICNRVKYRLNTQDCNMIVISSYKDIV